jgi:AraC-like DNA-binding protein
MVKIGDRTVLSDKGFITITNPFEIHANPVFDSSHKNDFITLYLSKDVVSYFLKDENVNFSLQQPFNPASQSAFLRIVDSVSNGNFDCLSTLLNQLLNSFQKQDVFELDHHPVFNNQWKELLELIDNSLQTKITLDDLAKFMGMNKFSLAKEFRLKHGLSPIHYVIMRKVFEMKKLIRKDTNLTHLAHQFHFADSAHFSKQFKRFVGLSPRAFKNQIF